MGYIIFVALLISAIILWSFFAHDKRQRTLRIVSGFLLMLIALPVTVAFELGVNGCCGAPSTGYENVGYVIGFFIFISGLILTIMSVRKRV